MPKLPSGAWILLAFVVLIGVAIYFSSQKPIELKPQAPKETTKSSGPSDLPFLTNPVSQLPEFAGITNWWNTKENRPLTAADLKGKVVLVDFWTYSCINCIRTQPVLKKWWETYQDDGLVIVGVHTPEFAFEKVPKNVEDAIKSAGLKYPIALDPDYATWNAYANHYWPAEYLFDRQGKLRFTHFGEGRYDESEAAIRSLLAETKALTDQPTGVDTTPKFAMTETQETYFGYSRMESFANNDQLKRDQSSVYTIHEPTADQWSIGGNWRIENEKAVALTKNNSFRMNIESDAMHVVLGSTDGPKLVQVMIDGKNPANENLTDSTAQQKDGSVFIAIGQKALYRIARFPNGGRHAVELKTLDDGVEFYAATFGE